MFFTLWIYLSFPVLLRAEESLGEAAVFPLKDLGIRKVPCKISWGYLVDHSCQNHLPGPRVPGVNLIPSLSYKAIA